MSICCSCRFYTALYPVTNRILIVSNRQDPKRSLPLLLCYVKFGAKVNSSCRVFTNKLHYHTIKNQKAFI